MSPTLKQPPSSLPGLTRQSMAQPKSRSFVCLQGFGMDARVTPAHDEE